MMKKVIIPGLFLSLVFVSCTNFFTTSWGEWAARDPASLIPTVTRDNVDKLVSDAENNSDLSLEVLKGIGKSVENASGEDKTKLQNAAVTAAANAANLTNTLINNVPNIANLEKPEDVKDLVTSTLNSMNNLTPTADALTGILAQDTDAFVNSASAEDLALAAALILAGEAKKGGDAIFTDPTTATIPPESQAVVDLAEKLAVAALDKQPADGETSNLLDLLTELGFQPSSPPSPPSPPSLPSPTVP
jgi:hypothetical protein